MRKAALLILFFIASIALPIENCTKLVGPLGFSEPTALAIAGNKIYATMSEFMIFDISTPYLPDIVGRRYVDGSGVYHGMDVSEPYCYIADYHIGLLIFDVSNPSLPNQIGIFNLPRAYGISLVGTQAFVATYTDGLKILDISNPIAPIEVGNIDTPGIATNVAIVGNLAYVADYYSLRIIDISDSSRPIEIGAFDLAEGAIDVSINGKYAYIANGHSGLMILNIESSSAITIVGQCNTGDYAWGLVYVEGLVFVADGFAGLRIINVNDPTSPIAIGSFAVPYTYDVVISGDYAYAGNWIFNISACHQSKHSRPVAPPH